MGLFIYKFKVIVPGEHQKSGLILILDLSALTVKLLCLSKNPCHYRNICIAPQLYEEKKPLFE